jgi:hypothetical protein
MQLIWNPRQDILVGEEVIIMAQRKPEEQATFDQVLKLVENFTPEEQDRLIEEMKLQWLRRELGKAEAELRRGEGVPGEQVFAELRERNKAIREKGGTV